MWLAGIRLTALRTERRLIGSWRGRHRLAGQAAGLPVRLLSIVMRAYSARIDRRWRSLEISIRSVTSFRRRARTFRVGVRDDSGAGSLRLDARAGRPTRVGNEVKMLVAGLHGRCPCLSAGFTHPIGRAHGHMTDRTGRRDGCQLQNRRSSGICLFG